MKNTLKIAAYLGANGKIVLQTIAILPDNASPYQIVGFAFEPHEDGYAILKQCLNGQAPISMYGNKFRFDEL